MRKAFKFFDKAKVQNKRGLKATTSTIISLHFINDSKLNKRYYKNKIIF